MKLFQYASFRTYRKAISNEETAGRLPMARFTWGYIEGLGWGFLRPWEQNALFPEKGTLAGQSNALRYHEPFWILRTRSFDGSFQHKNHGYQIEGRYWHGYVWRASFGPWWRFWRARFALLDPDIVTYDPGKADDWGSRPGEQW